MIDELWNSACLLIMAILMFYLLCGRKVRSAPVWALATVFVMSLYLRSELYQLAAMRGSGLEEMDGLFVRDAYRTTDNEIRFVYFKNTQFRNHLKFFDGAKWRVVAERRVDPLMRLFLRCQFEAHLAVVRFENQSDASTLWLTSEIAKEKYPIRVKDVRQPATFSSTFDYTHKLGVCLQPIYFHADWTLFVQYFEFWIASGATKFYIYLHSSTKQVREVLDFYKRKLGDNMEIIPWSDLPVAAVDRGDFHADPNTRVFRVGIHGAINDCLLRARYQVKFLSMLDLDETLQVPVGNTVVGELDSLSVDFPRMGTISLQWLYAEHQNDNAEARYPSEISFASFKEIRRPLESLVNGVYRDFRKVIQRPERVALTDIHSTLVNELLDAEFYLNSVPEGAISVVANAITDIARFQGEGRDLRTSPYRYWEQRVPTGRMAVVHLRRFNPTPASNKKPLYSNDTTTFWSFLHVAQFMHNGYTMRLKDDTFANYDTGEWQQTVENTMRTLEECRYYPFNHKQTIGKGACQSIANCEPLISDKHQFLRVDQVWRNVAHRGKIVQYVKN